MELMHYGVKGMRWGVRKDNPNVLFVSGSSKTETKGSPYYRKKLPRDIRSKLNDSMWEGEKIIVGDAPGIDRQVQNYLKKKRYSNVEVYGPGKQVRYLANKKWKANPIDVPGAEPMSKEWLAGKDFVMTDISTKGLAVILDEGATATRNNVQRLIDQNKSVDVYMLTQDRQDRWV